MSLQYSKDEQHRIKKITANHIQYIYEGINSQSNSNKNNQLQPC